MDAIAPKGHRGRKADNMFPFGQVWQALESFRRLESKEDDEKEEGDRKGEEARDGKGCEDERCGTSETGSGFSFLHLPAGGPFGQNVALACFLPIQKTPIG